MCIAFFTLNQPGYKLILASNRDEYLDRPTLPAGWHNFDPFILPTHGDEGGSALLQPDNHAGPRLERGRVLSGRDRGKAEGGTWLGISKDLNVGLITNIRLVPPATHVQPSSNPPSRGLLLKQFLSPDLDDTLHQDGIVSDANAKGSASSNVDSNNKARGGSAKQSPSVHQYLQSHLPTAGDYEGFNLLLFSLATQSPEVGYLTNRPEPDMQDLHPPTYLDKQVEMPKDGGEVRCYGISNSPMGQPWEKVVKGEERMKESLHEWKEGREGAKNLVKRMFEVLSQSIPIGHDDDLTRSTLIPPLLLQNDMLANADPSSPSTQWKGTRTSTVILVKDSGEVVFVEKDIAELGEDGRPRKSQGDGGKGERWFEFIGETR